MSAAERSLMGGLVVLATVATLATGSVGPAGNRARGSSFLARAIPATTLAAALGPPRAAGYFRTRAPGSWRDLPGDSACAQRLHSSIWEPRPDNAGPNYRMPKRSLVHASFARRPVAIGGAYDRRWDSWLLQRVTGHHTGTTDENIQWAACKWGISDNVLRAIAVRESTWFQYEVYRSRRCVTNWGCGDMVTTPTVASRRFCGAISQYGHNYQRDYGRGRCPKTFSIAGVMSWQDPRWGRMPGNQNGTFPFNRNSTAFAVDYLGSFLRGCHEGWVRWLDNTGTGDYRAGRLWGCVGAWYAGAWRTADANGYAHRVHQALNDRVWLRRSWPKESPSCSPQFGCPRGS